MGGRRGREQHADGEGSSATDGHERRGRGGRDERDVGEQLIEAPDRGADDGRGGPESHHERREGPSGFAERLHAHRPGGQADRHGSDRTQHHGERHRVGPRDRAEQRPEHRHTGSLGDGARRDRRENVIPSAVTTRVRQT